MQEIPKNRKDASGNNVVDDDGNPIIDMVMDPVFSEWPWHFKVPNENFGERVQRIVEKYIEEFLQYHRMRGQTLQEYVSEFNLKHEKAQQQGLDFGPMVKGYWFLRQGRMTEDQKR